jgi:hypothetical protein
MEKGLYSDMAATAEKDENALMRLFLAKHIM